MASYTKISVDISIAVETAMGEAYAERLGEELHARLQATVDEFNRERGGRTSEETIERGFRDPFAPFKPTDPLLN